MATPHLISVPISPYCPACGWEFAENPPKNAAISKFCASCGVDLSISQFDNVAGDQPASLLPALVTDVVESGTDVTFSVGINPLSDDTEYQARVNTNPWGAWTTATASHVLPGASGNRIDFRLRSLVTGPPAISGASGIIAFGFVL